MELSPDVLDGLQIVGDGAKIPDDDFLHFLESTCGSLLTADNTDFKKATPALEPAPLKQAHAALGVLLLEAARQDRDTSSLSHVLEECKLSPDRVLAVEKLYTSYKDKIRLLLSNSGTCLPHIVDARWRLDYNIKSSDLERVNEPTYLIELKTQQGAASNEDVQFSCTQNQLQDLVGKLKDACKGLERAGQM